MEFSDLLNEITNNNSLHRLDAAIKMCQSGDVRDVEWSQETLLMFSQLLPTTWRAFATATNKAERTLASENIRKANEIFFIVIHIPEVGFH
jgi:hypothetical protein